MHKRSDGRYARQIMVGKKEAKNKDGSPRLNENGAPVMIKDYVTVYGRTQNEVDEAYLHVKMQLGKGIDVKAANDNFKLWADRFIEGKKARRLSFGYLTQLDSALKHLQPINDIPLSKITIGDVQSLIDRLSIWHDGQAPLAWRTLRSIRETAGQIFKLAIASRVITYNPAEYVTIPDGSPKNNRDALTQEQQGWVNMPLLVKVDKDIHPHRACRAAMIMMYAGLRRGELLALTWADIDTKAATINVNKAVVFKNNRPTIKHGMVKTEAGLRLVDIPKKLCQYLEQEHENDPCMYVIHNRSGKLMTEAAWKRMWESYMSALNLEYGYTKEEKAEENITSVHNPDGLQMRINTFTAHQLRHTFCTLMYLAGVDILTARDQMGHRDIQTTLQIYTHLDKIHKRKSMNKLDKYIGQSGVSQSTKNSTVVHLIDKKA